MNNFLEIVGKAFKLCINHIRYEQDSFANEELTRSLKDVVEAMRIERPEKTDPQWEALMQELSECIDTLHTPN